MKERDLLVTPGSLPLALIAPRISNTDHGNLSFGAACLDVDLKIEKQELHTYIYLYSEIYKRKELDVTCS